jgi:ParB family transcriptional regulator, chromosome partitioning protein
MSAKHAETIVESGTEIFIPLNKLKKSPKNARKTPHSEAAIEAYAASIAAKGILQNLVVEPELEATVRLPASIPSPSARAGGSPSF